MKYILALIMLVIVLSGGYFLFRSEQRTPIAKPTPAPTKVSAMNMTMHHDKDAMKIVDDKAFLEAMIPHHQEAIVASQEVLKVSKSAEVQSLAQDVITAQQKEVTEMKDWYKKWYGVDYKPSGKYQPMMTTLAGKNAPIAEKTYLTQMITHHEGAIAMAREVESESKHDEVKQLSQAIISSQSKEIETIESLLNK